MTRNAWWFVARREVTVRATDRTFLIGTSLTLAVIVGLIVLQGFLAGRTETYQLAAAPAAVELAEAVEERAPSPGQDIRVVVREVADDAAGRAAVASESADAWLHQQDGSWVLTTRSQPEALLEAAVSTVVRDSVLTANAERAGTSVAALQAGTTLRTSLLEGDAQRAELVGMVGFAFAFLFYIASLLFGITLANSVLEEKQSRVVEIIASRIPLGQLLAGKVAGNTVLALVQLLLYTAVGLVGLAFSDYSTLVPGLSGPILWFIVFFLAGFAALACLWAVAGSLASRTEDLQATTTPLTMLVLGVLFGGLLLEGDARTVGSFVPPVSAVVMPLRLLEGDATWWEALVALALLLLAAALTVGFGSRLYRRSLLQSGGRLSLRQAWRAEV